MDFLMKSVTFTGVREIELSLDIANRLHDNVENYINKGCINFICGGAIGSDTWFAKSVLKHKEQYPQIKLIICQPCQEQDKLWNPKQKEEYKKILDKADEVILVSDLPYAAFLMLKRNEFMLARADYVLSIYNFKGSGGTFDTLKKAENLEYIKEILIIKP